jgi:hypothetical protein
MARANRSKRKSTSTKGINGISVKVEDIPQGRRRPKDFWTAATEPQNVVEAIIIVARIVSKLLMEW